MTPQSISISNFKSFGTQTAVAPIRPITLIFGPNSAGKSSLLQSLLFFDHALATEKLDIATPRRAAGALDLGGFSQMVNKGSSLRSFSQAFTFDPTTIMSKKGSWIIADRSITLNLTYGKLTYPDVLGTKSFSIEIDNQLLLSARNDNNGHMRIEMLDFEHPCLAKVMATIGVGRMEDDSDDEVSAPMNAIHWDALSFYLDLLIRKEILGIHTDGLLPLSLVVEATLDPTDLPSNEEIFMIEGLESDWGEHLETFREETLPGAFTALFHVLASKLSDFANSIRHVPPLRELPPRVFDLNQHPDPIWRRIADQAELRTRINKWLGADFMKSRYELQVREFVPMDEFDKNLPSAVEDTFLEIFENTELGGELDQIFTDLWTEYENIDHLAYVKSQPDLYDTLIDIQLMELDEWARADTHNSLADRDYLLLSDREKRIRARDAVDEIVPANWFDEELIQKHYFRQSQQLQGFLQEKWDGEKTSQVIRGRLFPHPSSHRKEITLSALPANTKVSLQDVGVGISQVLPVLMSAFAEEDATIAIEQPEIHIHPALQAELADVFIESALGENKNTFLLETHSEHLILRLLRRIRETTEGDFDDWPEALKQACPNGIRPEDIAVLYVEPGEEGSTILELPVNSEGDFDRPWPSGFFTERAKELY